MICLAMYVSDIFKKKAKKEWKPREERLYKYLFEETEDIIYIKNV